MNRKQIVMVGFLAEFAGVVFCSVFLASYLLALPSNDVLHAESIYREMLAIFGGLFLFLIIVSLLLSSLANRYRKSAECNK